MVLNLSRSNERSKMNLNNIHEDLIMKLVNEQNKPSSYQFSLFLIRLGDFLCLYVCVSLVDY